MKRNKLISRILTLALIICMTMTSFSIPVAATETAPAPAGLSFEKVDNSVIEGSLIQEEPLVLEETSPEHKDSDIVRVSIVLKEASVVDAGYSTEDLVTNSAAMKHLDKVKGNQKNAEKKIAKAIGKSLKVKHNLGLVANIISADVAYGDIAKIESVSEVKDVVLEAQYSPNADLPQMAIAAGNMTGAVQAWADGYTGAGSRIAIIDTGIDLDHQSFDNDAFMYALEQDAKAAGKKLKPYLNSVKLLNQAEIAAALPYLNAYAMTDGKLSAADVSFSDKVPFGFNYVDTNTNVKHIYDSQGEHGSHVAGISAANRFLKNGKTYADAIASVGVAGNAPDAQLIVMKVFGQGGGAYDSDYMAAIEDAIILNCDSVNLSLGSSSAGMATSPTYQEILDKLDKTNTVVVMSAGNTGAWADNAFYGDLYADGMNFDTAGSPGSFANSLAVASADNVGMYGYSFTVAGKQYGFNESATYGNEPLITLAGDGSATYDYVFLPGVGAEEEYEGIDVTGKVVFCKRGELSFFEKANFAAARGAIATIIYNNQPGTIGLNLTGYAYTAPCVSISQDDAAAIQAASAASADGSYYTGQITITDQTSAILGDTEQINMSSFSSWGLPGDLSMKPEITAPGGNIWSVAGSHNAGGGIDQYELMSGTSMAAPQVSGMSAVLMKQVKNAKITGAGLTNRGIVQSLLMSTATPLTASDGSYYSVIQQGAGLGNVKSAMNAHTIIKMGSDATVSAADGKVKAELGDDPEKKGVYTFSFSLFNKTKQNVTYKLSGDVFTQATDGDFLYGATMDVPAQVSFTVNGKKASEVSVKKNSSATVKVQIALDAQTKALFDTYYPAGAYVEAYVFAKPTDGSSVHSIPVLGYYGNWTDSSMYDIGSYVDYYFGLENRPPYLYASNNVNGNLFTVNFADGSGEYPLGVNLYAEEEVYHPEYVSINNANGDSIKSISYSLIRNAGAVAVSVTDAETGAEYLSGNLGSQYGAFYNENSSAWANTRSRIGLNWKGTDAEGQPLAEGTTVNVGVTAVPEYYIAEDGSYDASKLGDGAFLQTSVTIDNTAPEVLAVTDGESGSLGVAASDNLAVAAIMLFSQNGRTLIGSVAVGAPEMTAWLASGLEDDVYLVAAVDYAGNMSTYRVFMNIEPTDQVESVELDQNELVLMKNNSAKLTATVLPDTIINENVIWSSSDESVATVDANGLVTAVATGSCTIIAAAEVDPTVTAECSVTVISIEKKLNAVVWDEEGEVWLSQINTAIIPDYKKLTASSWKTPINNLAYSADGQLYATDIDTQNGVSNLYTVDGAYNLNLVGSSEIAYTDMAEAPSLGDVFVATYFNYLVIVDAQTGDYLGAFDYLGSADLVGIAYAGSQYHPGYGQYIDTYYLLDSTGNLYYEAMINMNGSYYYFMGAEDALLGGTGIDCDISYFQSLYFDGDYTYASNFNESLNSVTLYAIDTEQSGDVYALGTFADGVWPVAALTKLPDTDVSSAQAAKFQNVSASSKAADTNISKKALKAVKKN